MKNAENPAFVSILTVMVEYGNAPFLWRVDSPDEVGIGPNVCDGTFWDESYPMSEGLWRKFADWAIEFDRTRFYSESFDTDNWDWIAFNLRGLQLSQWLKEEVGIAYRIVYQKPIEDPNHGIDERTEILTDGQLLPLVSIIRPWAKSLRRIISGGQTGADRAALDFAIDYGYNHGGWAPHGRMAEDGVIAVKYQLVEMEEGGYRQRTRHNVEGSDATLIVNLGELDGGTSATQVFAEKLGKPCLTVQVDSGVSISIAEGVVAWLGQHNVKRLNVAGPRESKRPGIYRLVFDLLAAIDTLFPLANTNK